MAIARRLPWPWFIVGGVVVAIIGFPVLRSIVGDAALAVVTPLRILRVSAGDQWFTDTNQHDSERLQQTVDTLTTQLYESKLQLETIQAAVKITDFAQQARHEIVRASVVTTSPDPGIQSIIIDRGSSDGVQRGQAVIAEQGFVIGKIVSLRQSQSTVLLVTDRQSVLAARTLNDKQSPGVVRGERGLSLLMQFIPKNDTLTVGDTIVTSGTEPLIPPDLIIGSLASSTSRSGDLFQQAVITPTAAIQRLRVVGVVVR
jgi:rod shape-determining protein MreC